jgi:ribosome-binding protein aMBF1 (putative translation factor)
MVTRPKRRIAPRKAAKKPAARRAQWRDDTPVIVGRQIRALREAAGLSQHELAQRASIRQPDVSSIESGAIDMRLSSANRIARSLGVTLRELLP